METKQIAALATAIAAARAFDYAGNYGRGVFRYEVSVREVDGVVTLTAICNAQITEKRALAELDAVWVALVAQVGDDAPRFKQKFVGGKRVWRGGWWHMGRFITERFSRGLELRPVVTA